MDSQAPEFRILSVEEIKRRFAHLHGLPYREARMSVTRGDVARFTGIGLRMLLKHEAGDSAILPKYQKLYSQFFALLDAGCIGVRYERQRKVVERIIPVAGASKRQPLPHIDFGGRVPKIVME